MRPEGKGSYAQCTGLAVFDLDAFVATASRSNVWRCPLCPATGNASALRRDLYVSGILAALRNRPDVRSVDLKRDGSWQVGGGCLVTPQETEAALAGTFALAAQAGDEHTDCIIIDE